MARNAGFADDYVDVATRIVQFREQYPDGRLRPVNPDEPFRVVELGNRTFIVYTAAAYRTPDDAMPGIGTAWEPFPGPTSFTKDSELMNAETGAWGRAIIAALAGDAKKGIATREDVQRREAPGGAGTPSPAPPAVAARSKSHRSLLEQVDAAIVEAGIDENTADKMRAFAANSEEHAAKTLDRIDAIAAEGAS